MEINVPHSVRKRNGDIEQWSTAKIIKAVMAAGLEESEAIVLASYVEHTFRIENSVDIEAIQDEVETQLMANAYSSVAKTFILYREERRKLRWMKAPDLLSAYIHASKYSRNGETFTQTVDRVCRMHIKRWPNLETSINAAFRQVDLKKVLPSMRSMQFAGAPIESHNARMFNCSYTLIDRKEVLGEILYLLLCGCGVGYSVRRRHVANMPTFQEVNSQLVWHCTVEDNIEGWSNAVNALVEAHIKGIWIEYDYSWLRPEGAPLNSGGKTPGHIPLKKTLETLRLKFHPGRLTALEWHDCICYLALAVLAGGVRRSSLISLFDENDQEMMNCKSKENFDYNGKNFQRAMANNSVVNPKDLQRVLDYNRKSFGEPGFYFCDGDNGTNPCGEIILNPKFEGRTGFAFCNLTEVNCKNLDENSFLGACEAAAFIGTLQASYTNIPYLTDITRKCMESEALIGVSLTGIVDAPWLTAALLKEGYVCVKEENKRIAKLIGIHPAKRLTTIKPSGTASLLLNCASGIHPHHSKRYVRRVTANKNEPVARAFAEKNQVLIKPNGDLCLEFAVEGGYCDETARDFLDRVSLFSENWTDHNVSATCVYRESEWDTLCSWIRDNGIRSMSFLPFSSDKNIPYIPRERADYEIWERLCKQLEVDYSECATTLDIDVACSGGQCEIVHSGHCDAPGVLFNGKDYVKWF